MGLQTKVDRQGLSGFGALGQTVQERKTTGKYRRKSKQRFKTNNGMDKS